MSAKVHGLEEEAQKIWEQSQNKPGSPPPLPQSPHLLVPALPIHRRPEENWPLLAINKGVLDSALSGNNMLAAHSAMEEEGDLDAWGDDDAFAQPKEQTQVDLMDEEGGGWDLDDDVKLQIDEKTARELKQAQNLEFQPPSEGPSPPSLWCRRSTHPSEHIAAGQFETAMQVSLW
jgi:coatomer protein complex subunit alpha (xenin)